MLGVIELRRRLDVPMTVIVSELGAWNSRNVPWTQLQAVRDQMFNFLRCIGLDEAQTRLRSHLDFDNLVRAGKIARYLSRQDFLDNSESLLELYDSHGLLGSEVGIMVDSLYTVADVLEPAEHGTGHILMVSGLEEAYFRAGGRAAAPTRLPAGAPRSLPLPSRADTVLASPPDRPPLHPTDPGASAKPITERAAGDSARRSGVTPAGADRPAARRQPLT